MCVNRIRQLRINAGMSQSCLAELLNVDRTSVGKYELNHVEPGCDTLIRLCNIFGVTTDYLLDYSPETYRQVRINRTNGTYKGYLKNDREILYAAEEDKSYELRKKAEHC